MEINNEKKINGKNLDTLFHEATISTYVHKNYKKALEIYDKILKNDTKNNRALLRKGEVLYDMGRYEEALSIFDKIINKYPIVPRFRGDTLLKMGRYEEAIEMYDKAMDGGIKHSHYRMIKYKGDALRVLGRYEEAIEMYDKALDLNPKYYETLYSKSDVLFELGRKEDAAKMREKALKIDQKIHQGLINYYLNIILNILGIKKENILKIKENILNRKVTNNTSNLKGKISLGFGLASILLWEFSLFPLLAIVFGIFGALDAIKNKSKIGISFAGLILGVLYLIVRIYNGF